MTTLHPFPPFASFSPGTVVRSAIKHSPLLRISEAALLNYVPSRLHDYCPNCDWNCPNTPMWSFIDCSFFKRSSLDFFDEPNFPVSNLTTISINFVGGILENDVNGAKLLAALKWRLIYNDLWYRYNTNEIHTSITSASEESSSN